MKITPYTALLSAILLAPTAAAQNLLTNADFEAGLTGWSSFGNAFAESANPPEIVPLSGSQVCKMFGLFGPGFDVSGIFQSFPATAGESFEIDAWSRHWSGDPLTGTGAPNDNWVVMKIAFFDAGNTEIGAAEGTILDGNSPTDTWIDNTSVTGTAPPGTTSVQALILFLQPGTAGGAAQIEDVSFEPYTPPMTGNLLANPDFEAGLTGWGAFGNVFAENSNPPEIVPLSGSQVCKMFGLFSPGFDVSGIFQSFPAVPGEMFKIDAWSRHWSGDPLTGTGAPNDNWVVMKIAFFDAGNTEIGAAEGTILDGNSPTDTWIDNTPVIGTAPPGTASVQALILFLQPGTAGGAAQIEDVSFERDNGECFLLLGTQQWNFPLGADILLVEPILVIPMSLNNLPSLAIPNHNGLVGLSIYTQSLLYNPVVFPQDPVKVSDGLDFQIGVATTQYGSPSGMLIWPTGQQVAQPGGALSVGFSIF